MISGVSSAVESASPVPKPHLTRNATLNWLLCLIKGSRTRAGVAVELHGLIICLGIELQVYGGACMVSLWVVISNPASAGRHLVFYHPLM